LDFPSSPTSRPCFQVDAQALPHRRDFFDGAPTASGKDGIGYFAEPFKFGNGPKRTSAALESGLSDKSHELLPFYANPPHHASANPGGLEDW
jgi:hypothetical protein